MGLDTFGFYRYYPCRLPLLSSYAARPHWWHLALKAHRYICHCSVGIEAVVGQKVLASFNLLSGDRVTGAWSEYSRNFLTITNQGDKRACSGRHSQYTGCRGSIGLKWLLHHAETCLSVELEKIVIVVWWLKALWLYWGEGPSKHRFGPKSFLPRFLHAQGLENHCRVYKSI